MHTYQRIICYRTTGCIDSDEKVIPNHKYNTQDFRESKTKQHTEPKYLFASLYIASAIILTHKCHCCLSKCRRYIVCKILKVLATLIGQKKRERINSTLHTVITFGILLGIGLMAVGMLVVRIVLEASGTPTEVMDEAMIYIRIYLLGVPFMLTYNFGSALQMYESDGIL